MVLAKKVEDLSLNPDFPADAKGIPKFWLHVLKNGNEEALMGLVEEHDEAVLENLTNITVALDSDNAGFTLSFHFQENDYFTNQVCCQYLWSISVRPCFRICAFYLLKGVDQALQTAPRPKP